MTTEPPAPSPAAGQDTHAHPDADTLADLAEGLLPPSRAAAVTDHLAVCPACAGDLALLRDVPGRLAAAGAVGAFPSDLAARLEVAAAEEGRTATATITPLRSASRPARQNRVLQAAAAAVLVLAATAVGISAFQGGGAQQAEDMAGEASAGAARDVGSVRVLATGTDYEAGSLPAAVPGLLAADGPEVAVRAQRGAAGDDAAPQEGAVADTGRLADGAALGGCVSALTDDPDTADVELPTPLVVDIATFDRRPATVVVLPAPGLPDRLDVFVVGPDCSPADAKVLHFARVLRP